MLCPGSQEGAPLLPDLVGFVTAQSAPAPPSQTQALGAPLDAHSHPARLPGGASEVKSLGRIWRECLV